MTGIKSHSRPDRLDKLWHRVLALLASLNPKVTIRNKRLQGPYLLHGQASDTALPSSFCSVSSLVPSAPSLGIRDKKELGLDVLRTSLV